jgi:hypothetical protein
MIQATAQNKQPDAAQMRKFIELTRKPGEVFEIRCVEAKLRGDNKRYKTVGGFFDDTENCVRAIGRIESATAVYITLNPVNPQLKARCYNRLQGGEKGQQTSDRDILKRTTILIDVDAIRPAGISATDEEHEAAITLVAEIYKDLTAEGAPDGIYGSSGNGSHLLYAIDLPADDGGLVGRFLESLDQKYHRTVTLADGTVIELKVDATNRNAARITKLFGTYACKGDEVDGRRHRMSEFLHGAPDHLEVFPTELLERIASRYIPPAKAEACSDKTYSGSSDFDLVAWLAKYEPEAEGPQDWQGGKLWQLPVCPFNEQHNRGEAFVGQTAKGPLTAGCHHASCQHWGWKEYRELREPSATRPRRQHIMMPKGGYDFGELSAPSNVIDDSIDAAVNGEASPHATRNNGDRETLSQTSGESKGPRFPIITAAELVESDYRVEFILNGILAARQPGVILGPPKGMKTSVGLDMALSIATGGCFLGRFRADRPRRVLFVSAESGLGTLQETFIRQSDAAYVDPRTIENLDFCDTAPQFRDAMDMQEFRKVLEAGRYEVVFIDPLYLCADVGGREGSLFAMGEQLRRVSEVCRPLGITLLILHHLKRSVQNPHEPGELSDASWAGVSEFARQWVIVNRREKYQPGTGLHKLWLTYGGSAGQSGLERVNIEEGIGHGNRYWSVSFVDEGDDSAERVDRKDQQRRQRAADQVARDVRKVLDYLIKHPAGDTKTKIRDGIGINGTRAGAAIECALENGAIEPCEVTKNGRTESGYRIAENTAAACT